MLDSDSDSDNCSLADGFSLQEKIYAQVSFFTMSIVGTVGIVLEDWRWVIPYIVINWYGVPGIIMRHVTCPRCPHLYEYGDCLQFPPGGTRWIVKKQKATPLSALEKVLFYTLFILIPAYPLYWLSSNKILLLVFLIAVGTWYSGQFLYFCKRCRVHDCPFNRAPKAGAL